MKILNGVALWADIQKAGLHAKAVGEFSLQDVERLADILDVWCESQKSPYFKDGEIVIPFASPWKCRWWQHDFSDREKMGLLLRLGVPESGLTRYMSQRAIDVAKGACDNMGRPRKQQPLPSNPCPSGS